MEEKRLKFTNNNLRFKNLQFFQISCQINFGEVQAVQLLTKRFNQITLQQCKHIGRNKF